MELPPQRFIGLMSGTSLDAIDAVITELTDNDIQLISTHSEPIPDTLRKNILSLCTPGADNVDLLGTTDTQLGLLFAKATNHLLENAHLTATDIIAIGSHGQTIRHQPNIEHPFTIQIGDPHIIASKTNITTVADFRRKNIANNGQGAPLTPAFHEFLLKNLDSPQAVLNIGGMANLTFMGPDQKTVGHDTGPGNVLLDIWCQIHTSSHYDNNGDWARSGSIDNSLLKQMLNDPYFNQPAPKSTGREHFNQSWLSHQLENTPAQSPENIQATLTELTAISITDSINNHKTIPTTLWVTGGGAYNNHLLDRIQLGCPQLTIKNIEQLGIPADWLEACAFAWLAKQTLDKKTVSLSHVTGATQDDILGGVFFK